MSKRRKPEPSKRSQYDIRKKKDATPGDILYSSADRPGKLTELRPGNYYGTPKVKANKRKKATPAKGKRPLNNQPKRKKRQTKNASYNTPLMVTPAAANFVTEIMEPNPEDMEVVPTEDSSALYTLSNVAPSLANPNFNETTPDLIDLLQPKKQMGPIELAMRERWKNEEAERLAGRREVQASHTDLVPVPQNPTLVPMTEFPKPKGRKKKQAPKGPSTSEQEKQLEDLLGMNNPLGMVVVPPLRSPIQKGGRNSHTKISSVPLRSLPEPLIQTLVADRKKKLDMKNPLYSTLQPAIKTLIVNRITKDANPSNAKSPKVRNEAIRDMDNLGIGYSALVESNPTYLTTKIYNNPKTQVGARRAEVASYLDGKITVDDLAAYMLAQKRASRRSSGKKKR